MLKEGEIDTISQDDAYLVVGKLAVKYKFVDEEQIMATMEDLIRRLFKEAIDVDLPAEFPRMSWDESMRRFGNDKPETGYIP